MRRVTKFAVALIALGAAAAFAAVVVPFAIADRVWGLAVAQAEAATGTRISADGPVRLKLFPVPRLLVSTVEVATATGAALVHIDRARLELGWGDLLAGRTGARRIQLRYARFLMLPPHPPVDLTIDGDGQTASVAASFEGGGVHGGVRLSSGGLTVEGLTAVLGGYTANGSAHLTLSGDPRIVVTLDRIQSGATALGRAGAAAMLTSDSVVIERLLFQGADGTEASFFGLAMADHGAVRLEGGLEGRVRASAATVEATARVAASFSGENGRVDITDIDLRTPTSRLSGVLRAELAAEPSIFADLRLDTLDLDAAATPALGMLSSLAAVSKAELRLRIGRVAWQGMAADGVILDIARSGLQLTLRELAARNVGGAPFHAEGRFALTSPVTTVNVGSLAFRYATLAGTGRGSVDISGAVPRIQIDAVLNGPLALDAIVPPLPPLPPEPMTRRAAAAAAATPRPAALPAGWSRERFSLPPIPAVEADIHLAIPRLTWRGLRLDDADLNARIGDGALILETLAGRLYEGRFELRGRAAVAEGIPTFSGTASVAGGDLKSVLRDYAGINEIAGSLDGTAQLAATGNSAAELMAGLNGTAQIRCRDGTINGFDLPGMSNGLKRMQRPTDLAETFRLGLGGGRTPFSALDGLFRIERGVARTENLKLVAKGGEIRTAGAVDLAAWTLDIGNQFRLTEHPDLPPFALKLSGPMVAPRRVFDIQDLQAQLVRRGRPPAR